MKYDSTRRQERAGIVDSTKHVERAINEDSNMYEERAKKMDSARKPERAKKQDRNIKHERAKQQARREGAGSGTRSVAMDNEKVRKLDKDIRRAAAEGLSRQEARYLVDMYYQIQEHRIATAAQGRALGEAGEPNGVIEYLTAELAVLEAEIKKALLAYAGADPVGRWSLSICGIGPVIAAGLLAHIDIEKAPTAGHVWSFAGLYPGQEWKKGQKRPWNAALKTLCWKIGESFVKVSGNEKDVYGKVYRRRKEFEQGMNERGDYAAQAAEKLEGGRIGKDTAAREWYSQGKLPPAHIHSRAKRYATKLFLAHWHQVAYEARYGERAPNPYPVAIGDHAHEIAAPAWERPERPGRQ